MSDSRLRKTNSDGSRSKTRIRINDVIADAKASLAEPTRPITPAGGFNSNIPNARGGSATTALYMNNMNNNAGSNRNGTGNIMQRMHLTNRSYNRISSHGPSTAAAEVNGINITTSKTIEPVRIIRTGHKLQPIRHRQNSHEKEFDVAPREHEKVSAPPSVDYNDVSDADMGYGVLDDDVDEYEYFKKKYGSGADITDERPYELELNIGKHNNNNVDRYSVADRYGNEDDSTSSDEGEPDECVAEDGEYVSLSPHAVDMHQNSSSTLCYLLTDINDAIDSISTHTSSFAYSDAPNKPIFALLSSLFIQSDGLTGRIMTYITSNRNAEADMSHGVMVDIQWSLHTLFNAVSGTIEYLLTCIPITSTIKLNKNDVLINELTILLKACRCILKVSSYHMKMNSTGAPPSGQADLNTNESLDVFRSVIQSIHHVYTVMGQLNNVTDTCSDNLQAISDINENVIDYFCIDYCMTIAEYYTEHVMFDKLKKMLRSGNNKSSIISNDVDDDVMALNTIQLVLHCVELLNSVSAPNCSKHKLKLICTPLVKHLSVLLNNILNITHVIYKYYAKLYISLYTKANLSISDSKCVKNTNLSAMNNQELHCINHASSTIQYKGFHSNMKECLMSMSQVCCKCAAIIRDYFNNNEDKVEERLKKQVLSNIQSYTCSNIDIEMKTKSNIKLKGGGNIVLLLCEIMKPFCYINSELHLYCVRILAKFSVVDAFRQVLHKNASSVINCMLYGTIYLEGRQCKTLMDGGSISEVTVDTTWPQWYTWPLLSRVSYILGNLTTTNENNRIILGSNVYGHDAHQGFLMYLQCLLAVCSDLMCSLISQCDGGDTSNSDDDSESEGNGTDNSMNYTTNRQQLITPVKRKSKSKRKQSASMIEIEDVTIKLIRLFANLAINSANGECIVGSNCILRRPGSGSSGAEEPTCRVLDILYDLLKCIVSVENDVIRNSHEELLLNAIATITNLTYYSCGVPSSDDGTSAPVCSPKTNKQLVLISKQLSKCFFHENFEIVLETTRAYGNLSRNIALLSHIEAYSIHKLLCTLLEMYIDMPNSVIIQIQYNIIGILMNLSGSERGRSMLCSIYIDNTRDIEQSNSDFDTKVGTIDLLNQSKLIYLLFKLLKKTSFKNPAKFDVSILTCQVYRA